MSYMILGYGSYDAPDGVTDIETKEEAMNILHAWIKEWRARHFCFWLAF